MEFNVGWNTDMFPYLFRYRLQYRTSVVRHQQFFLDARPSSQHALASHEQVFMLELAYNFIT
jgi:hypothetical protein